MEDTGNALIPEHCYITMVSGTRAGTNFRLKTDSPNRLGRGIDCDVVLADPMCSRVHAEILWSDNVWKLQDAGSRNGTFVDNKRVDEIVLEHGSLIRLGSSEFSFHSVDQLPTLAITREERMTESIVREAIIDSEDSGRIAVAALRHSNNAAELGVLLELCVKLMSCDDPLEVQQTTLELILARTHASVAGFLWVTDEGELRPQLVTPHEDDRSISLSRSLTTLVLEQRRAVWVATQARSSSAESLKAYADALCIPVIFESRVLGALHMYLGHGQFRDQDFDFAISLSHIFAAALARTRQQAKLHADHQRLLQRSADSQELLGVSEPIKKLKHLIQRVATAAGPVLITGESGCGKELVARAVHQASPRGDRPMLAVNCSAIPESLVESHLFGHVKGAFTGASEDRRGWFEQTHAGTLFLDEIGELPLDAQGKLLRILEGHPFLPVGGTKEIKVDVRVIAATNRDLRHLVKEKKFREDLFYRLSVFELFVPPLRDRGADVELLMNYFLDSFRTSHGRLNLKLSESARRMLLAYSWPGNVRQLRNVLDSAVVLATGDEIRSEDLGLNDGILDELESLRWDDMERKLIRKALDRTGQNIPEAAKLMGIGRATLYRKIEEYGLNRK
jgi:two-component system, NtrC family, response regulator HydG